MKLPEEHKEEYGGDIFVTVYFNPDEGYMASINNSVDEVIKERRAKEKYFNSKELKTFIEVNVSFWERVFNYTKTLNKSPKKEEIKIELSDILNFQKDAETEKPQKPL